MSFCVIIESGQCVYDLDYSCQYKITGERNSTLASHPAAPGLILVGPENFSPNVAPNILTAQLSTVNRDFTINAIAKLASCLFFRGKKKNGFFIEAGAFDGQTISNSLYFEIKHQVTIL